MLKAKRKTTTKEFQDFWSLEATDVAMKKFVSSGDYGDIQTDIRDYIAKHFGYDDSYKFDDVLGGCLDEIVSDSIESLKEI